MQLSAFCCAVIAGCGSWLSVTLGAALTFLRHDFSRRSMDAQLGVAGGMMIAASFFGLLTPAMVMTKSLGAFSFAPITVGLLIGAAFLWGVDQALPHAHEAQGTTEGFTTEWHGSALLVMAMALHHIPEGLSIGVGYGAVSTVDVLAKGVSGISLSTALVLSLSIMLQNLPEGLVVAAVMRSKGASAVNAFLCGSLSGITAPLGAALGVVLTGATATILPVTLSFAAGAMIYVVIEEVIPEANASGNGNLAAVASIFGVCVVLVFTALFG